MERNMRMLHVAVLAAVLGVAPAAAAGTTEAPERSGATDAGSASVLLAIDQNRGTIVDRIVNEWGDRLVAAGAGLGRDQLKQMLLAMRADQLLAASLAGSLDGLKSIVAASTAATGKARIAAAGVGPDGLGSANSDLVYTPVTPCRLFDTRTSQGGAGTPALNVARTVGVVTPVASQGGPGGCTAPAGAVVALVSIGTLTPSGAGVLQGGPQGTTSFTNALILYQPGDQYGTTVAMPLSTAGEFDLVELFAPADLYGDLLGYFAPPLVTKLDCSGVQNSATIAKGGTTIDVNASCTAGYTATGGGCVYFNLDGSAPSPAQTGVVLSRSAHARDSATGALLDQWTCRGTNSDATTDYKLAARVQCCRIPGR